jgi:hypothetical protein
MEFEFFYVPVRLSWRDPSPIFERPKACSLRRCFVIRHVSVDACGSLNRIHVLRYRQGLESECAAEKSLAFSTRIAIYFLNRMDRVAKAIQLVVSFFCTWEVLGSDTGPYLDVLTDFVRVAVGKYQNCSSDLATTTTFHIPTK